jgi:hypothetical protein
VVPFPAGGLPSHGSWFPSLLWCGASLTGVIALGVGWRPVGPLGCSLSACSQDVVSFIEIKKRKAKKKKTLHQGGPGVNSWPCIPLSSLSPCCHQHLLVLLLRVSFGLLALLWLWLLGVIVAAVVVIAIWVLVLVLVVVVVIIVM